mgnify:CR=1 FL=1
MDAILWIGLFVLSLAVLVKGSDWFIEAAEQIGLALGIPSFVIGVTIVAMGTSLADRAWGRESAVYRVAGVINVIGGWFLTAITAFLAAAIVAYLISWDMVMIPVLLALVAFLIGRNTLIHRKKSKEVKKQVHLERAELITINGVIEESSDHIAEVATRVNKLYTNVVKKRLLSVPDGSSQSASPAGSRRRAHLPPTNRGSPVKKYGCLPCHSGASDPAR